MIRLCIQSCLAAWLLSAAFLPAVSAQSSGPDEVAVPLSDPSRPAAVMVSTVMGNIIVRGSDRKDVLVRSAEASRRASGRRRQPEPPPPGMRRLTPYAGFTVEERNNEVIIAGPDCPPPTPPAPPRPGSSFVPPVPKGVPCGPLNINFEIEVPAKTNLTVSTVNGDVSVTSVDGELEINSVSGDVSLGGVAGSAVAHSVNGDVTAVLMRVDGTAPMAFSTLNGDVDVTLPAATKANLKLRTDVGDVFTDFDIPSTAIRQAPRGGRQSDGRFRLDVERAILTTLNGGGPDIELRSFNGRVYLRRGK